MSITARTGHYDMVAPNESAPLSSCDREREGERESLAFGLPPHWTLVWPPVPDALVVTVFVNATCVSPVRGPPTPEFFRSYHQQQHPSEDLAVALFFHTLRPFVRRVAPAARPPTSIFVSATGGVSVGPPRPTTRFEWTSCTCCRRLSTCYHIASWG